MFGTLKVLPVVAIAGLVLTGGAHAATFSFGSGGDFATNNSNGVDSLSATVDGITLTMLGSTSVAPGAVGSSFDGTANPRTVINQNVGAGVCGSNLLGTSGCIGQPLIDSGEAMIFSFSEAVTVESLGVFNNDQNDFVDFWFGNTLDNLQYVYSDNLIGPPDRTEVIDNSSGSFTDALFFAVSLRQLPGTANPNERDQFRLTSIDVTGSTPVDPPSEVPLPAAGWMLLGGLAGLGVMRRRKKAA